MKSFVLAVAVVVSLVAGGVAGAVTVGWDRVSNFPTKLRVELGEGEQQSRLYMRVIAKRAICHTDPKKRNIVDTWMDEKDPWEVQSKIASVTKRTMTEAWVTPEIFRVTLYFGQSFLGEYEFQTQYRLLFNSRVLDSLQTKWLYAEQLGLAVVTFPEPGRLQGVEMMMDGSKLPLSVVVVEGGKEETIDVREAYGPLKPLEVEGAGRKPPDGFIVQPVEW